MNICMCVYTYFMYIYTHTYIQGYGSTETAACATVQECFGADGRPADRGGGRVGAIQPANEIKLLSVPDMGYLVTDSPPRCVLVYFVGTHVCVVVFVCACVCVCSMVFIMSHSYAHIHKYCSSAIPFLVERQTAKGGEGHGVKGKGRRLLFLGAVSALVFERKRK